VNRQDGWKRVKVHCRGIASPQWIRPSVGPMRWDFGKYHHIENLGFLVPGKKILCSIAIDWVTRRFIVASIWSFVVWSVRTDLFLHCIIPTKGICRLNVQSGQPKLKTNWGDRVVIPRGWGTALCVLYQPLSEGCHCDQVNWKLKPGKQWMERWGI